MALRSTRLARLTVALSCLLALSSPAAAGRPERSRQTRSGPRHEHAVASVPLPPPGLDGPRAAAASLAAPRRPAALLEAEEPRKPQEIADWRSRHGASLATISDADETLAPSGGPTRAFPHHHHHHRWVEHLEDKRIYVVAPVVFLVLAALAHLTLGRRSPSPAAAGAVSEAPINDGNPLAKSAFGSTDGAGELPDSGLAAIFLLTSYRFFTGFLGATWAPFLIAREGAALGDRQAFFVGSCKLIYGASICLNPFLGFMNDRLAKSTSFCGRSAFLTAGVLLCTAGIVICQRARDNNDFTVYLLGAVVWMIGEAMADTTTECVVPELLPARQFDLASSIRSLNFLTGCLVGLASLIWFKHIQNYTWLYAAYLLVMYACTLMTIMMIQGRHREQVSSHVEEDTEPWASVLECYTKPMNYVGGFPGACLCLLIFSFGIAPMFFPMLIVRDLCGIDELTEQLDFSARSSILFTVCAAAGSIAINLRKGDAEDAAESRLPDVERKDVDKTVLIIGMIAFGLASGATPVMHFSSDLQTRKAISMTLSGLIGVSFGAVYARFQSCLWQTLPPDADLANAMGFASVPKVCGCGIGSFFAGVALDAFRIRDDPGQHITVGGYWVICLLCTATSFLSAALLYRIRLRS